MMNNKLGSLVPSGPLNEKLIQIEALYRRGLPNFLISGMTGNKGRELCEKIRSAIISSGISWPLGHIQIHLSPADLPKTGAHLDLAIATSLLRTIETSQMTNCLMNRSDVLFLGELSIIGEILPIGESALLSLKAASFGFQYLAICKSDLKYSRFSNVSKILILENLLDVLKPIDRVRSISPDRLTANNLKRPKLPEAPMSLEKKIARVITASCAGQHSLLMIGPPGSGKSTLARLMHSLLSGPDENQGLELMNINFQKFESDGAIRLERPLQSPHHSCTTRAMIGGGQPITPGEVTRAHHGILLLDELSEFKRDTLQALREPLLDKCVYLSRGKQMLIMPANFLLIATSNPCPCGYFGSDEKQCSCNSRALKNYMQLLLGPLRDRIEIELFVGNRQKGKEQTSIKNILQDIDRMCEIQCNRYEYLPFNRNADIPLAYIDEFCRIVEKDAKSCWVDLLEKNEYSQRALYAIRRLARTLADLDSATEIRAIDLLEAANLRLLDNFYLDLGQ